MLHITPKTSRVQKFQGRLKWTGDPETIRKIAEDDEPASGSMPLAYASGFH